MIQRPEEEPRCLPSGTRLVDIFDDQQGQLLILGAPGAGKTTLLLELADELLNRAEQDEEHPIPVVFNLSTWAVHTQSLAEWLISELTLRSDAPKKLAREWVTKEQILPLLDGLDEVAADCRADCVSVINEYRRRHGWVPIAVCSRTAEYQALADRLALPGAVVVRPLEHQQIAEYLESAGEALAGVRQALQTNVRLWEVLETPLMLSILTLAYRHLPGTPSIDDRHIFGHYIDAMFRRRKKETRYAEATMRAWLRWLAANLISRGQTQFFLEDVVPEWCLKRKSAWFTVLTIGITSSLFLAYILILDSVTILLASGPWPPDPDLFLDDSLSALTAVFFGAMFARRAGPVEAIQMRFPGWTAFGVALLQGAATGACAAFFGGHAFAIISSRDLPFVDQWWLSLAMALVGSLSFSFMFSVRALLTPKMLTQSGKPGALVHRSALSALMSFAILTGFGLPFYVYSLLPVFYNQDEQLWYVAIAYTFGLVVYLSPLLAFERGGYFVIRHYLARLVLWWNNWAPWNYVAFLSAAEERVILRRVGGGYIFVHRLLMEHLADEDA